MGVGIAESNIDAFIQKTNEMYADVPAEPVYWVDFIWAKDELKPKVILDIAESKNY